MTWQPIETAPKDGTSVLIAVGATGEDKCVGEASVDTDSGRWWWANSHGEYWAEEIDIRWGWPTHWMPLPEPPTKEE